MQALQNGFPILDILPSSRREIALFCNTEIRRKTVQERNFRCFQGFVNCTGNWHRLCNLSDDRTGWEHHRGVQDLGGAGAVSKGENGAGVRHAFAALRDAGGVVRSVSVCARKC